MTVLYLLLHSCATTISGLVAVLFMHDVIEFKFIISHYLLCYFMLSLMYSYLLSAQHFKQPLFLAGFDP